MPRDRLTFPDNVSFYIDHLAQLGLAGVYQEGNQEPLRDENGKQTGTKVISQYRLTELGSRFVKACTGD